MAAAGVATTLRDIPFDGALEERAGGAMFVDIRPVTQYLGGHIPESIALHYEFGPGMAARARDCLPLDVPLIVLGFGHGDLHHAAASLRGKGFTVLGSLADPLRHWVARFGPPRATDVENGSTAPGDSLVVDVGDPGAPRQPGMVKIPVEQLWPRAKELSEHQRVVIAAGAGVRAALAIGILERAGISHVSLWQPRP